MKQPTKKDLEIALTRAKEEQKDMMNLLNEDFIGYDDAGGDEEMGFLETTISVLQAALEKSEPAENGNILRRVQIKQTLCGYVDLLGKDEEDILRLADALYNREGEELPDMDDGFPLQFAILDNEGNTKEDKKSLYVVTTRKCDFSSIECILSIYGADAGVADAIKAGHEKWIEDDANVLTQHDFVLNELKSAGYASELCPFKNVSI